MDSSIQINTSPVDKIQILGLEPGEQLPTGAMNIQTMSALYPKYFKDVQDLDEVDVYQVHDLFQVNDTSGCIHHASKKLLLSGVRTGGKTKFEDIREARDTLTRWLQINQP